jgi:hypothetical protein
MYPSPLQKLKNETALKRAAVQKSAAKLFGDRLTDIRVNEPQNYEAALKVVRDFAQTHFPHPKP